jgi:hypothetical protein
MTICRTRNRTEPEPNPEPDLTDELATKGESPMLSTKAIKTPREKANELLDRIAAEGLPSAEAINARGGLSLIFTNVYCRFPCSICLGHTEKEEVHYNLAGSFDDLVCHRCGELYAPNRAAIKRAWDERQSLTADQLTVLSDAWAAARWPREAFIERIAERAQTARELDERAAKAERTRRAADEIDFI